MSISSDFTEIGIILILAVSLYIFFSLRKFVFFQIERSINEIDKKISNLKEEIGNFPEWEKTSKKINEENVSSSHFSEDDGTRLEIQNLVMDLAIKKKEEELKNRHYSILRKAAKDMIDSLVYIPPFRKMEENIPVPPIDSNQTWIDLVKNHIPSQKTDLADEWRKYISVVNRCSELKINVLREFENYLVRGTGLVRSEHGTDSDKGDLYYVSDMLYPLLNRIYFNMQISIESPEISVETRKNKKVKPEDMFLNGKVFVHAPINIINLVKERFQYLLVDNPIMPVESMKQLLNAIDSANEMVGDIKEVLNWFIFENTDMLTCNMIEEMKQ
jgi:hypothetical protein